MNKTAAKYDPGTEINGNGWLSLHRNENLFVGPDWTVDAARELVAKAEIANYPGPASDNLRNGLAEMYDVSPENIFVGNGSDEVLADLLDLLRHSYADMYLLDACFKIYYLLAERYGFNVRTLPGNTFKTGEVNVDGWKGLAVVDSPNAITSSCISQASLNKIAGKNNSFLIWDNAYGEFAGDGVPKLIKKNVVVVRSFSKFYALAGLRVGYCIADSALIAEMLARKDAFNVNGFAQVMAVEALRRKSEFSGLREQVLACRLELVTRLQALGFRVHKPGGNFVLATHPDCHAEIIQHRLMQRQIAVRRFPDALTANYIRITVPPMPVVEHFSSVLSEVLVNNE